MSRFSSGIFPTSNRLGVNAAQLQPPPTQSPLSPFELGPGSSSFEFQSSPAQAPGVLPSQGSSFSQPGSTPFFFGPNQQNSSGLRLPVSPERTDPFSRDQGQRFGVDREVVGTSTSGRPIFSFKQGARDKITDAGLEFGSPDFNQDLAALLGSFDPGPQTDAAQDLLQGAFKAFNERDFGSAGVPIGTAGAFVQGANTGASGATGGSAFTGLPQESALNESLVGLIGSLLQSLLASGQFASGGGVQPPAPQALFRTDLDRLGANRF